MAVLTPTTTPSVSKLGPPELPVLMGASPRHLVAKLPLEMPAMTQPWSQPSMTAGVMAGAEGAFKPIAAPCCPKHR